MSGQSVVGKETLIQRVGKAFQEVVANKLNGKVPKLVSRKLNAREDGHHPIISYIIQDEYSGTETRVDIAVGHSRPEKNIYHAWIGRNYGPSSHSNRWVNRNYEPQPNDYQEFSSLEEIGDEAIKVFSHDYTVDVMGI